MALLLTSLLACACASSPPVQYLVLDPVGSQVEALKGWGNPVRISSVHLPAILDRRQLVRQEGPNRLTISKRYRWASPLADMTQRVLSQDLILRLSPGEVILPGQPPPARLSAISVDVLAFGIDASGMTVLEGSWSVIPSGSDVAVRSHRFQLHQPATGSDFAAQAQAMSALLGRLADSIAVDFATRRSD